MNWRAPLEKILLWFLAAIKTRERPARRRPFWRRKFRPPAWAALLLYGAGLAFLLGSLFGGGPAGWTAGIGSAAAACVFLAVYFRREEPEILADPDGLALLLVIGLVSTFGVAAAALHWPVGWIPVGLPVLLVSVLIGPRPALLTGLTLSVLVGVLADMDLRAFLAAAGVSAFGGLASLHLRNRKEFVRLGYALALVQAGLSVALASSRPGPLPLSEAVRVAGGAVISGMASVILAMGLLPYLERLFGKVTMMRLLELADFKNELLHNLVSRAPGTYHHSLNVATLSEAAAEAIGASGLLCRVGAYYHDIGKTLQPEYFIENNPEASDKHGKMAAHFSSLLVISHVKDGIELGRKHGLDEPILRFIPEHHGTSRVHYFYQRALENGAAEPPADALYRYPGPKPQSPETAIVMLADAVEAATRAMEDPTPQRLRDTVYNVINNRFIDGQLEESPLKLSDLHRIAESFIATLIGMHHGRIPYPAGPAGGRRPKRQPARV